MLAPVLQQRLGERRRLEFDFSALLGAGEAITTAAVTAATLGGGGGAATVSAVARTDDAVSCLVATPAPGTYRVTATAQAPPQVLVLYAVIEVLPPPV